MGDKHRATITGISTEMKDEWGVITVGCLRNPEVYEHDVAALVTKMGGKKGWVKSLGHLLGHKFRQLGSVPESANGIMTALSASSASLAIVHSQKTERFGTEHKLGPYLKSIGALQKCTVPANLIEAAIEETVDPQSSRLSFGDSKSVAEVCWKWILKTYKHPGGDKILFVHLEHCLNELGIAPHRGSWRKVLTYRWRNARRMSASVRTTALMSMHMHMLMRMRMLMLMHDHLLCDDAPAVHLPEPHHQQARGCLAEPSRRGGSSPSRVK
jgi:hypothetical protein